MSPLNLGASISKSNVASVLNVLACPIIGEEIGAEILYVFFLEPFGTENKSNNPTNPHLLFSLESYSILYFRRL
jgi:hypothetical protein